ncbi:hypothetical protein LGN17_10070 [Burkholderia sp. AU30280]|uniref:hypothetical protein n=1 Tax=Burkholderia sp. AU30280 TaxID=2879628 RepID=UPI001CF1F17C|nr:hypothetical protein [Burkholderia sp. AU30280]MCA8272860.1 hypothetical protein [Burkholderia sp. AU30280]
MRGNKVTSPSVWVPPHDGNDKKQKAPSGAFSIKHHDGPDEEGTLQSIVTVADASAAGMEPIDEVKELIAVNLPICPVRHWTLTVLASIGVMVIFSPRQIKLYVLTELF